MNFHNYDFLKLLMKLPHLLKLMKFFTAWVKSKEQEKIFYSLQILNSFFHKLKVPEFRF